MDFKWWGEEIIPNSILKEEIGMGPRPHSPPPNSCSMVFLQP